MKVSMKEGCPAFSADGCAINGRLLGVYNVYNYLAAMQVGLILGIERDKIQVALEKIARVPGRMEEIKSGQPYRVLVDFAHTPDALHKAIRAARALSKGSRLLVVFGCPGDRDRTKRPVMGKIAAEEADIVIVTTDDPHSEDPAEIIKEIVAGVPLEEKVDVANVLGESKKHSGALDAKTYAIVDRRAAIETALSLAKPGEVVLLAGRGHEKFQDFNGRKIPLDDRAVVIELLGNLPR
jgi:UDP-N-acetylmuramyl-tripeptide synthetase